MEPLHASTSPPMRVSTAAARFELDILTVHSECIVRAMQLVTVIGKKLTARHVSLVEQTTLAMSVGMELCLLVRTSPLRSRRFGGRNAGQWSGREYASFDSSSLSLRKLLRWSPG